MLSFHLCHYQSSQEFVVISVKKGLAELWILNHEFLGQIVEVVLAVEEEQVLEGFRRE